MLFTLNHYCRQRTGIKIDRIDWIKVIPIAHQQRSEWIENMNFKVDKKVLS